SVGGGGRIQSALQHGLGHRGPGGPEGVPGPEGADRAGDRAAYAGTVQRRARGPVHPQSRQDRSGRHPRPGVPLMAAIHKITLPKWGLSMASARVDGWLKEVGALVKPGEELVEVETEKITGVVTTTGGGVLRRQLAPVGEVVPVGGLLGVVAEADVPETEIDAVVAAFLASFSVTSATEAE